MRATPTTPQKLLKSTISAFTAPTIGGAGRLDIFQSAPSINIQHPVPAPVTPSPLVKEKIHDEEDFGKITPTSTLASPPPLK